MSFGFGVGDFIAVITLAKNVYDACKDGPGEYQEIKRELRSIQFAFGALSDDAQDADSLLNRKGSKRRDDLLEIVKNCEVCMNTLQQLVDKHSDLQSKAKGRLVRKWDAYRVGSADLDTIRGRLTFHLSCIHVFQQSLQSSNAARMEAKIDEIYAKLFREDPVHDSSCSIRSVQSASTIATFLSCVEDPDQDAWDGLRELLLSAGICESDINAHKEDILNHIKKLVEKETGSMTQHHVEGSTTEYDDAGKEWAYATGLQNLDQTTIPRMVSVPTRTRRLERDKNKEPPKIYAVRWGRVSGQPALSVHLEIQKNSIPNGLGIHSISLRFPGCKGVNVVNMAPKAFQYGSWVHRANHAFNLPLEPEASGSAKMECHAHSFEDGLPKLRAHIRELPGGDHDATWVVNIRRLIMPYFSSLPSSLTLFAVFTYKVPPLLVEAYQMRHFDDLSPNLQVSYHSTRQTLTPVETEEELTV